MIDLGLQVRRLWSSGADRIVALWDRLRPQPFVYRVMMVEELPDRLRPGLLYVVSEGRVETQASMACPHRRCGDTLNMNLLPDDHPMWKLAVGEDGKPSLSPSVWRRRDCGCHFWLKGGRVDWCR